MNRLDGEMEFIGYEIWQDDMCVAGASGQGALSEIMHYATIYSQDAPIKIYKTWREEVTLKDGGNGG